MGSPTTVLAFFAHPDDAEFLCAGTLIHLAARGATVHLATLTAGDCGSSTLSPEKISTIRQREAARSAKLVGGTYHCLGEKDLSIFYDRRTLMKVMHLVRKTRPNLVVTHSPIDYMVDHETVSRLAQTACFGSTAPNYGNPAQRNLGKPLAAIPRLYYTEPFGARDIFGAAIRPHLFVNIAGTIRRKLEMLACHESQQAWLRAQQGMADYRRMVHQMAEQAGRVCGFRWAEGFRQHLGQGFPQDNLAGTLLGDLMRDARG